MKHLGPGLLLALFATSLAPAGWSAPKATSGQESEAPARIGRIEGLLAAHPDTFASVVERGRELRLQILLGEVRDTEAGPELVQNSYRLDAEYFYPASTIKLVAAITALERLNDLRRTTAPKISERTPLAFHPLFKGEVLEATDESNVEGGVITLEHLIRKALIVSDNAAYNRLYDFCGQEWLNQRAWRAGLRDAKLSHRLSVSRTQVDNKRTCAIELRFDDEPIVVDARWSNVGELGVIGPKGVYVGKAHRDRSGEVDKPMSFFHKSYLPLRDMQLALARVVRPDLIKLPGELFDITDEQRALLADALSVYPGDSKNPVWSREQYPDDYAKFFLTGVTRVLPKESVRIYNKVGLAYGFVTDNAYIVDTKSGKGFFLAVTMYANSDEVLNDDKYDYETVAFPFFADFAEVVARDIWAAPASQEKKQ